MAEVNVTHPFASAKADGADTTRVKPSDWNDEHVYAGGAAADCVVYDAGSSTLASWARRSRVLNLDTTATGNVGAGEDDLISYTLPASTLGANGQTLRVTVHGTMAANANAKALKFYFGATAISLVTTTGVPNGLDWRAEAVVARTGAATQEMFTTASAGTVFERAVRSTPTETLSGAVEIKCTAEAVADDDVVQRLLMVELLN